MVPDNSIDRNNNSVISGPAAIIDLNLIKNNILNIKNKIGENVMLCPIVKADAYGHGAIPISRMLEINRLADYLGVARVEEGIKLRQAGLTLPILLLGLTMEENYEESIKNDLSLALFEEQSINRIDKISQKFNKKTKIHLKVDTGLGRIGCKPKDALKLARFIQNKNNLYLEGIFSHFSESTYKDKTFSFTQLKRFNNALKDLEDNKINIPIKHMANSGAVLDLPDSYFDMVRPGLINYGYYPSEDVSKSIILKPAMKLMSRIVYIKRVEEGIPISYRRRYIAEKDTFIATIPIGYGDGIPRELSKNHNVIINNMQYPIAGTVCMDQIMVDLGDDYYEIGTEVEIFGNDKITAYEIAKKANTNVYDILCRIKRVQKHYLESEL